MKKVLKKLALGVLTLVAAMLVYGFVMMLEMGVKQRQETEDESFLVSDALEPSAPIVSGDASQADKARALLNAPLLVLKADSGAALQTVDMTDITLGDGTLARMVTLHYRLADGRSARLYTASPREAAVRLPVQTLNLSWSENSLTLCERHAAALQGGGVCALIASNELCAFMLEADETPGGLSDIKALAASCALE